MNNTIQTALLLAILALLLSQRRLRAFPARNAAQRKLIMDTCALIDGRIVELVQSGFIRDELVVPEFILHELQLLADGSDAHKRERARFGLDVVKQLQDMPEARVSIDTTAFERQPNDDKLVALAQQRKALLYTTDYNLNKLADIKGVTVLNVNELAQQLRPVALPGERATVKILQKGSNPKQGVGYLDDGTMIVVDGAAKLTGKTIEVEITRTHQTVAGKMLFGVLVQPPVQTAVSTPRTKSASTKTMPRVEQSQELVQQPSAKTLANRMRRARRNSRTRSID